MIGSIHDLPRQGQSLWYDGLKRDLIRTGKLAHLIEEGVRGLTTNPAIYEKAIGETGDYDADIAALGARDSARRRSTRRWRCRTCRRQPTSCARCGAPSCHRMGMLASVRARLRTIE